MISLNISLIYKSTLANDNTNMDTYTHINTQTKTDTKVWQSEWKPE